MFTKCKTNCQANKYLWIRNNIFYYMVELLQENGKRRCFCKSSYTKNYYEAQEYEKHIKLFDNFQYRYVFK